jgi:hypothetical protein
MPDELTTADWAEVRKLLSISADELHALELDEVRSGANLLRSVADQCKRRSYAMKKFADAKESLGTRDEG